MVYEGLGCGACDKIKDLQDDWKQLREELKEATEKLTVAYKTIEQMEVANLRTTETIDELLAPLSPLRRD